MRKVIAVLGLSVVLLGACGGGGDDGDTDAASGATTTAAAGSATTVSPGAGGLGVGGFCGFRETLGAAQPTPTGGDMKTALETAVAQIDRAVDASPSEIKADMRTVATVLKAWAAELKSTNYDYMKSAPKAQAIWTEDVQNAGQRVNDWVAKNCK